MIGGMTTDGLKSLWANVQSTQKAPQVQEAQVKNPVTAPKKELEIGNVDAFQKIKGTDTRKEAAMAMLNNQQAEAQIQAQVEIQENGVRNLPDEVVKQKVVNSSQPDNIIGDEAGEAEKANSGKEKEVTNEKEVKDVKTSTIPKIDRLAEKYNTNKTEKAKENDQLKNPEAETDEFQNQMDEVQATMNGAQGDELQAQIDELQAKFDSLKTDGYKDAENYLSGKELGESQNKLFLEAVAKEKNNLKSSIRDLDPKIKNLKEKINEFEKAIKVYKAVGNETKLNELEQKLEKATTILTKDQKSFQKNITKLGQIVNLEKTIENGQKSIIEKTAKILGKETDQVQDLATERKNLKSGIRGLESNAKQLKKQITSMEEKCVDGQPKPIGLAKLKEELTENQKNLQDNITKLGKIVKLEKTTKETDKQLSSFAKKILKAEMEVMGPEAKEIKGEIADLNEKIRALETKPLESKKEIAVKPAESIKLFPDNTAKDVGKPASSELKSNKAEEISKELVGLEKEIKSLESRKTEIEVTFGISGMKKYAQLNKTLDELNSIAGDNSPMHKKLGEDFKTLANYCPNSKDKISLGELKDIENKISVCQNNLKQKETEFTTIQTKLNDRDLVFASEIHEENSEERLTSNIDSENMRSLPLEAMGKNSANDRFEELENNIAPKLNIAEIEKDHPKNYQRLNQLTANIFNKYGDKLQKENIVKEDLKHLFTTLAANGMPFDDITKPELHGLAGTAQINDEVTGTGVDGHYVNSIAVSLSMLIDEGRLTKGLIGKIETLVKSDVSKKLKEGKAGLVKSVLQDIAFPTSISQHNRGTCAATVAQIFLVLNNPEKYIDIIKSLASPSGGVETNLITNGMNRVKGTLEDDMSGRSVTGRLIQPAFMAYEQEKTYDNFVGAHIDTTQTKDLKMPEAITGKLESFLKKNFPEDKFPGRADEIASVLEKGPLSIEPGEILNKNFSDRTTLRARSEAVLKTLSLTDPEKKIVIDVVEKLSKSPSGGLSDNDVNQILTGLGYNPTFSKSTNSKDPKENEKVFQKLKEHIDAHKGPVPTGLSWRSSGHEVLVTHIDDKTKSVYFMNPWGELNQMPISDFKVRVDGLSMIDTPFKKLPGDASELDKYTKLESYKYMKNEEIIKESNLGHKVRELISNTLKGIDIRESQMYDLVNFLEREKGGALETAIETKIKEVKTPDIKIKLQALEELVSLLKSENFLPDADIKELLNKTDINNLDGLKVQALEELISLLKSENFLPDADIKELLNKTDINSLDGLTKLSQKCKFLKASTSKESEMISKDNAKTAILDPASPWAQRTKKAIELYNTAKPFRDDKIVSWEDFKDQIKKALSDETPKKVQNLIDLYTNLTPAMKAGHDLLISDKVTKEDIELQLKAVLKDPDPEKALALESLYKGVRSDVIKWANAKDIITNYDSSFIEPFTKELNVKTAAWENDEKLVKVEEKLIKAGISDDKVDKWETELDLLNNPDVKKELKSFLEKASSLENYGIISHDQTTKLIGDVVKNANKPQDIKDQLTNMDKAEQNYKEKFELINNPDVKKELETFLEKASSLENYGIISHDQTTKLIGDVVKNANKPQDIKDQLTNMAKAGQNYKEKFDLLNKPDVKTEWDKLVKIVSSLETQDIISHYQATKIIKDVVINPVVIKEQLAKLSNGFKKANSLNSDLEGFEKVKDKKAFKEELNKILTGAIDNIETKLDEIKSKDPVFQSIKLMKTFTDNMQKLEDSVNDLITSGDMVEAFKFNDVKDVLADVLYDAKKKEDVIDKLQHLNEISINITSIIDNLAFVYTEEDETEAKNKLEDLLQEKGLSSLKDKIPDFNDPHKDFHAAVQIIRELFSPATVLKCLKEKIGVK